MTEKISNFLSHWAVIIPLCIGAMGSTSAMFWQFNEAKLEREREKEKYINMKKQCSTNTEEIDKLILRIIKSEEKSGYLEQLIYYNKHRNGSQDESNVKTNSTR